MSHESTDVWAYCKSDQNTVPRIEVQLRKVPNASTLDSVFAHALKWLEGEGADEPHVVLLLKHVETEQLEPPSGVQIISIVSKVLSLPDALQSRICGTCVQATVIDAPTEMAERLLRNSWDWKAPFRVVVGETKALAFSEKCLRKAASATREDARNPARP